MNKFLEWGLPALAVLSGVASLALGSVEGGQLIGLMLCGAFVSASVVARSCRTGVLVTALYAAGAGAYLFSRKLESAAGTEALCNVNATLNCDSVNSSEYSELFGFPIALLGVAFYLGLAVASMLSPAKTTRFFQIVALGGLASVAYSLFLGAVSASMGTFCIMCISMYAANAILLWAGLRGLKVAEMGLFEDLGSLLSSRSVSAIVITFAVVVFGGMQMIQGEKQASGVATLEQGGADKPLPGEALARFYSSPRGPTELDGSEPVYGDPNAPYTVVEWADYGCPHCAAAAKELKHLVDQNPDIQVRFKVYPLTSQCNPAVGRDSGPERCYAAVAADCAGKQGKFWDYQGLVFKNQHYLSLNDLRFMAEQSSLDLAAWDECVQDPSMLDGVLADARAGDAVGVEGTPTMVLQGTHGDSWLLIEGGVRAIERIVESHRAGTTLPAPLR